MNGRLIECLFLFVGCIICGCTSVGDFSTGPGECYEGPIVGADYVRSSSLDEDLSLTLTLDAAALLECELDEDSNDSATAECREGARITTSDDPKTFDGAPVRPIKQIPHDSLSLLQFPGGRIRNFVAYVSPTLGPPAMTVLSLMENDEVEVRIIRPPGSDGYEALFGVFRLVRKEGCDGIE